LRKKISPRLIGLPFKLEDDITVSIS
jgi:hypothetical protein